MLVTLYRQATPEQIARGRRWYPRYAVACRRVARDTATPARRVMATAAITSPVAQLATNLAWTRTACTDIGARVGRYPNAMAKRYLPILRGEIAPLAGLDGPKVRAFYRAILGDLDAIVLDRWALRAAGHPRDDCTPRQYERIAARYRRAAATVGENPRDFQAIVWVVLRERGRAKLADIHEL